MTLPYQSIYLNNAMKMVRHNDGRTNGYLWETYRKIFPSVPNNQSKFVALHMFVINFTKKMFFVASA